MELVKTFARYWRSRSPSWFFVVLAVGVAACNTSSSPASDAGGAGRAAGAGRPSAGAATGGGGAVVAATGGGGSGAGGGAFAGRGSGGAAGSSAKGVLKIIGIGDSITRATCWRARLWQTLNSAHAGRFDLVGTLKSDNGCNVSGYDQDNQGYSSSLLTEVVLGVTDARTCDPTCPTLADFASAFAATKPDVALIHYGTNDVWNAKPTADIVAGYSTLVDKLRAANPNVTVFVAKIIPMNVTSTTCGGCSCSACTSAVPALNAAIDDFAPAKSTAASPVQIVDQYTGFDASADTRDGVHPNDSGSQKMAAKWAAALEPLF
jgi:lysophospholipase L1-like esterase